MSLVWERAPYTAGSLLVLLALADWANDEGIAWPSMDRLAQKARVDRRSAQRIVRQLAKDGAIAIEEGGGRAKQHRYLIQVETITNYCPLAEKETATPRRPPEIKGDILDVERVTSEAQKATFDTETVTSAPPDPLEEPLEEPSVEPPAELRVFNFWRDHLNHPKAVFDEKRRKAVVARLRAGYSADDLILAVRGLKLTPHNMGDNERGTVFDDIELICRDTSHVERFIAQSQKETNGDGHKPKTASERNVVNLRESLARFQGRGGPNNPQESAGLLTANTDTRGKRTAGGGVV